MKWWNVTLMVVVGFAAARCGSAEGAGPAPAPVTKRPVGKVPVHPQPLPRPRSVNTHLRAPAAVKKTPAVKKTAKATPHAPKTTVVHVTGVHSRRVVAAPRRVVRHLTGSVAGYVSGGGEPVRGARVALRGPKGHAFHSAARRHVVYTDASGSFMMRRVRVARYRVVASKSGAGSGHAQLAMHNSGVHRVEVKLAAGKKKK
jgi:hypothetical protein